LRRYADNYFDLKERLESLLDRPVDLLEESAIRNPFLKKQIDSEKKLIYEQPKCTFQELKMTLVTSGSQP